MSFQNPYKFSFSLPLRRPAEFVCVDTETGGIDPAKHALLQLGFAGSHCDPASIYITDSDGTNEAGALLLNRIEPALVAKKGVSREKAREIFTAFVCGRAIVGHNLAFDLGFICSRLFDLGPYDAGVHLFDAMRLFDTYRIFRALHPKSEAPSAKLADVARFYHLEVECECCHDAMFDAELTCKIFLAELDEFERRGWR